MLQIQHPHPFMCRQYNVQVLHTAKESSQPQRSVVTLHVVRPALAPAVTQPLLCCCCQFKHQHNRTAGAELCNSATSPSFTRCTNRCTCNTARPPAAQPAPAARTSDLEDCLTITTTTSSDQNLHARHTVATSMQATGDPRHTRQPGRPAAAPCMRSHFWSHFWSHLRQPRRPRGTALLVTLPITL